jgi:hypothetical protein
MKTLAIILLISLPLDCFAQQYIEISGVVHNKRTKEAIAYASIHVSNTGVGTAANPEGKFHLKILSTLKDSTLIISCLGFNKQEIGISRVSPDNDQVFELEESQQVLQTVEVSPLDGRRIVENAIENITSNYKSDPHRLDAFYRTTIQDDNNFTRLLEAAVYINDSKGNVFGSRDIFIRQARKSNDLRKDKWKTADGYLTHLVRNHPLQAGHWDFLKKGKLKDFDIEIESTKFSDKQLYYVVSMKPKSSLPRVQCDVQLVVNEANFAIVDITIFWKPELGGFYTWAWEQRDSAKFVAHWQESRYTYQEYEGKYYLQSSRWHRKGKVVNKFDGKTIFNTESLDELLVTNIEKGKFKDEHQFFPTTDVYIIADQLPYNEAFWKTYNRPVDSEHFRKAKREMERIESLDIQFKKYTGASASDATSNKLKRKSKR